MLKHAPNEAHMAAFAPSTSLSSLAPQHCAVRSDSSLPDMITKIMTCNDTTCNYFLIKYQVVHVYYIISIVIQQ
jgi:hypothetical protein